MQKPKYVRLQNICSIYNHILTAKAFQTIGFKGEKDVKLIIWLILQGCIQIWSSIYTYLSP